MTAERNGKNIYTKSAFLLQSQDNPLVVGASGNHMESLYKTEQPLVNMYVLLLTYLFPKERACFSFVTV